MNITVYGDMSVSFRDYEGGKHGARMKALTAIALDVLRSMEDIELDDLIAMIHETIAAEVGPIKPGDEYPADLLALDDVMAEFTLIEGRFLVLSNVNGQQRFNGDYAIVEDRACKAILRFDNMTWVQATTWCVNEIERLNNAEL